MEGKNLYFLVNLTDEVMGISQSEIPDARDRSIAQKRYLSNLGYKFLIGMFGYRRGGSKSYWFVIFSIPQGASTPTTDLIKTIAEASRKSLARLSRWKTSDSIASIWYIVGSNNRLSTALLSTLLPDCMSPIFCDNKINN